MLSNELNIRKLQVSLPLFNFSSNKPAIAKVTYSIDSAMGSTGEQIRYYRFKHGVLMNSWR